MSRKSCANLGKSDKWKKRTVIFHSKQYSNKKNSHKQGEKWSVFVFIKNTHTFYSLPLYPNNCCKYLCSMSRLSQISLSAKIINVCVKNLSVYPNESVLKHLFDSVLDESHIFLRCLNTVIARFS